MYLFQCTVVYFIIYTCMYLSISSYLPEWAGHIMYIWKRCNSTKKSKLNRIKARKMCWNSQMKQIVQYLQRTISSRFHQWIPLQCIANILLRNYSRLMPLLGAIFSCNDIVHRHLPWVSTLRVNRNWILNKWRYSSHKFTLFNKALFRSHSCKTCMNNSCNVHIFLEMMF